MWFRRCILRLKAFSDFVENFGASSGFLHLHMWLHQGIFLLKALNNTVETLVDSPSYCFCASTPSLVRPLLAPFVVVFKQRLPTWMDGSHDSPHYCFGSSFLAPSVANDWDSWLLTSLDASLYSSFSACD